MAGEKAVKVQHVIHVPPPPPAPPGCGNLDSHCAQVTTSGLYCQQVCGCHHTPSARQWRTLKGPRPAQLADAATGC